MQCCLKSIKTTSNRIFSCALLSWASRTMLHWVFTCAMLFGASQTTLHIIFFLCNIVCASYLCSVSWDNIPQEKPYLVLPMRLWTTLYKKTFYSMSAFKFQLKSHQQNNCRDGSLKNIIWLGSASAIFFRT